MYFFIFKIRAWIALFKNIMCFKSFKNKTKNFLFSGSLIKERFNNQIINISKNLLIIILFSIQIQTVISKPLNTNKSETKSVIIGHLYRIIRKNPEILKILFDQIKLIEPDFIFILGDSELQDSKVVKKWRESFGHKVYFSPGNHEIINGSLEIFSKNVGYTEKIIETPNTRFLLGNSNTNSKGLIEFIEKSSKKSISKPTILLVHHRIWDDTLTSAKPFQHDKSYYLKDIFPTLEKYIDIIIAGNSKHQYFYDSFSYIGSQNMNNIYWVDRIGGISAYSIGTGIGSPKLGFIELISNKDYPAIIIPHHINTDPNLLDPIPIEAQKKVYGSIAPGSKNNHNVKIKQQIEFLKIHFRKYFGQRKKSTIKIFFYILGIVSTLLFIKFQKFLKKTFSD